MQGVSRRSTCNPPHEQWLMRLGAGGVLFVRCCRFSPSLPFSVIPPVIHPMSRCSWGWGWMVCRPLHCTLAWSSFHPWSTPRAVAREAGAGGVSFVALSPLHCAPCVIPPAIHPTSSGPWGWGWVVCHLWPLLGPALSLSLFHPWSTPRAVAREAGGGWCVVVALCRRYRCSTSVPPHKQLLARLGAGGGHGGMVLRRRHRSTRDPAHKQLLVRLGAGDGVVGCLGLVSVVSSSLNTKSS
jgi:hypothetical protein